MSKREVSEAVKNLKVDKAEFDAALQKLIATPPIRKAGIPKRTPWSGTPANHPSRKPYRP
jgi:hypothetical protein